MNTTFLTIIIPRNVNELGQYIRDLDGVTAAANIRRLENTRSVDADTNTKLQAEIPDCLLLSLLSYIPEALKPFASFDCQTLLQVEALERRGWNAYHRPERTRVTALLLPPPGAQNTIKKMVIEYGCWLPGLDDVLQKTEIEKIAKQVAEKLGAESRDVVFGPEEPPSHALLIIVQGDYCYNYILPKEE